MTKARIPAALLITALSACIVMASSQNQLVRRAQFDLQCANEELAFTPIDNRTQGVSGCGRQATYVEVCQPGSSCTWVLNSAPVASPAAAQPAGAP